MDPTAAAAGTGEGMAGAEPARPDAAGRSRRKTPEEVAYDVVAHFLAMVRAFYTAVAKSIHSPARRRGEDASQLSLGMKAAAASLALVLKGNLELQLPAGAAGADAGAASAGGAGASSAVGGGEAESEAARLRRQLSHLQRLSDELYNVLFDTRRRSVQLLVLYYFTMLGGVAVLADRFQQAFALLLAAADLPAATPAATPTGAAATGGEAAGAQPADETMADASGTAASGSSKDGAAKDAAAGAKDERKEVMALAEKVVHGFLTTLDQLTNASTLMESPQAATFLVAPIPATGAPFSSFSCIFAVLTAAFAALFCRCAVAVAGCCCLADFASWAWAARVRLLL